MTTRTVTLIGLPQTGKSTYLGALWMIIQDEGDTTIREVGIRGDRTYLNMLGESVAQLKRVDRTEVDSADGLELTVDLAGLGEVVLRIPDLSGETLRLLVEDRTWHDLLAEGVAESDALLLFVHPGALHEPIRTNFTSGLLEELLAPPDSGGATMSDAGVDGPSDPTDHGPQDEAEGDAADVPPAFVPRYAATAAKLIDAIENVLAERSSGEALKLGVVVSAWDEVLTAWPEGEPTPLAWMEQRLASVWQVLCANTERLDVTVYGVSAIGGRLPEDADRLRQFHSVRERAYALDGSGNPVPFAAPIRWALSR